MTIIGRLTMDAEVHTLSNQKQVVNFSIATNESFRNKQGERIEKTTYFDCSYWISPKVADFLKKGILVEISGDISSRAWIGKDGQAYSGLNFHTAQIKFHSSKNSNTANSESRNKNENRSSSFVSNTKTETTDQTKKEDEEDGGH